MESFPRCAVNAARPVISDSAASPRTPSRLGWFVLLLVVGHAAVDAGAGALPALVQHFRTQLALSYTLTGILVTASSLGGGVAQIGAGLWADWRPQPWMPAAGVALTAAGLGGAGFVHDARTATVALVLIALGSALFHPEAVRTVYLSGEERRATAMATFSIGGNLGWALGPAVVALLTGLWGLGGMRWWLLVGLPMAISLWLVTPRASSSPAAAASAPGAEDRDDWTAYLNVLLVSLLRGGVHLAVTIFYLGYLIDTLGRSRTEASLALSLLLASGIVSSPLLGRLADRFGPKTVLATTIAVLAGLVALLPVVPPRGVYPMMALVGASSMGTLPVSLVLGQQYLPSRRALGGGMQVAVSSFASLFATPFGILADRTSIPVVIWVAAALAAFGALLASRLPDRA
jgi:FSR family fosmidomycin resistance protein-like MFS transporter